MRKQKNIQQIYSDALYWAMSPKTKDKPYHLTRTLESVLRKLIHYNSSNPRISYSNEIIAQHTFLDTSTLEKAIPALNKKRYIKTVTFQINDGNGKITSRRLININWEFIESVLAEVPIPPTSEDNNEPNNDVADANGPAATYNEEMAKPSTSSTQIATQPIYRDEPTTEIIGGELIMGDNQNIIQLSLEKDIDCTELTGCMLAMNKKDGEPYTFQQAQIIADDGTVYLDEVCRVPDGKKKYYRKSQLQQSNPEIFEVA
jgi:hypothetical protein